MYDLIKMNDLEFQPLELVIQDRSADPLSRKANRKNNSQIVQKAFQQVTEDHFSKLYEYIHLNAKPLAQQLSKITRQHFSRINNKSKAPLTRESQAISFMRQSNAKKSVPRRHHDRLNKSCLEKSVEGIDSLTIIRDTSIEELSTKKPYKQKDEHNTTLERSHIPSIQYIGNAEQHKTKMKLPQILSKNQGSFNKGRNDSILKNKQAQGTLIPNLRDTPSSSSRDPTPQVEKTKQGLNITNLLMNPLLKEKYKARANMLKADNLLNVNNPDFGRLIRLISGDDKTSLVKLIKLTPEQVKAHLIKKYPIEIVEKFLQVMDFPPTFDTKTYLETFKSLLTGPLDMCYFLSFSLFDLNNDGIFDHRDIFVLFKMLDQYSVLKKDYEKLLRPEKKGINKLAHITKKVINVTSVTSVLQSGIDPNSDDKSSFLINKQSLTLKVNLLKNLEDMISKQTENKIMNLTQIKMIHQTDLASYLNYKRGKYRHRSFIDLFSSPQFQITRKPLVTEQLLTRGSSGSQTPSLLGGKLNDLLKPKKQINLLATGNSSEALLQWGDMGLDILGFSEIFIDDMPVLFYDILFHCLLVDFSNKSLNFQIDEVFDLYDLKTSKILTTQLTNNIYSSKITKTTQNSVIYEAKESFDMKYMDNEDIY